jgi:carboxylesterase
MTAAVETNAGVKPGAETIDLQEGNSHGVLLLHGFGDTPQTLGLLAQDLHENGFDVRVPLLPGHGTSVEEFIHSRRGDWIECARSELEAIASTHSTITLGGLSMGGALAASIASQTAGIQSLVLLSPYLDMPLTHRLASGSFWLWGPLAGVRRATSPRSIQDPGERAKNLGYGVYSGRLLYELWKVAAAGRAALSRITAPTLLVQSRDDPRIAPAVAEKAFASLASKDKQLVWVSGGHIITVDYGRDKVFEAVRSWIKAHET